ncbi:MAG TPA: hypothetical protein VGX16_02395, partial [Solirubrobacteraceae bacterium]|nr:hypothetical protein [Solirubrobacteraceae bacterium]
LNFVDLTGRGAIPAPIEGPGAASCADPATWVICGVLGGYIIKESVESLYNSFAGEEAGDEGGAEFKARQKEEAECEAESAEELGKRLRREGEELLGRSHSKATGERWQEWYNKLSKGDRRLCRKTEGPVRRRGG